MGQSIEERRRKSRINNRLRTIRYTNLETRLFWKPTKVVKETRTNRKCIECKNLVSKGALIRLDEERNHIWHYASTWESCWQTWVKKQMRKIAEREGDNKNGSV